jgi:hypothetical protein
MLNFTVTGLDLCLRVCKRTGANDVAITLIGASCPVRGLPTGIPGLPLDDSRPTGPLVLHGDRLGALTFQ